MVFCVTKLDLLGQALCNCLDFTWMMTMELQTTLCFDGVVIQNREFGFLAKQESEMFWRSDVSNLQSI